MLAFYLSNQVPEVTNLETEKADLDSSFWSLHAMAPLLCCGHSVHSAGTEHVTGKSCSAHSQESEDRKEEVRVPQCP